MSMGVEIERVVQDLGKDMIFSVNQLIISDNGKGFTKENIKSFEKYKIAYKQKIGTKGIGRFLFLKLFDKVSINSLDKNIKLA
jgi:anti-sigma regulatory factor (Ser/Thr protein kinase)